MPGNRPSSETCRASAAASRAFDGTHPVFTQVPPTVPRSIITTVRPVDRAAIAAANPAPPEPITARSYRILRPLSVGCPRDVSALTDTTMLTLYPFIRMCCNLM